MTPLKKLPIGMQTFEKIITDNYLYVDKTKYLYDLIEGGTVYFLSRPRRFGKSLTISTLQAIFEGKRKLFKDLAIDHLDYDWKPYPVIRFDMAEVSTQNAAQLPERIVVMLKRIMKNHEIETVISDNLSPAQMLIELVLALKKKYNQNVVILIDEYDKPLLDVIDDHALVDEIRKELSAFYSTLKALDDSLKFLFLTGVSQFAKTSIFSGLNQLENISLSEEASALCGYTHHEIDHYFSEYYVKLEQQYSQIRNQLKTWYDGYKFYKDGPALYNPFSILNALKKKNLDNYWFSTGTPTFLINLLKKQHFSLHSLDNLDVSQGEMSELVLENPQWPTVMYQAGYTTISDYNPHTQSYSLRIPNKEVHFSLFDRLLKGYIGDESYLNVRPLTPRIYRALVDNNWPLVIEYLKTIFAKIPYDVSIAREAYYQTIFYTSLLLSGLQVVVEETTNDGRIDCVVTTPTHRYIIEMKLDRPLAETFEQIEKKGYATKYANDKRTLVEIGIIFDSKGRTISDWNLKELS